jgi:hypothetical protein
MYTYIHLEWMQINKNFDNIQIFVLVVLALEFFYTNNQEI